MKSKFTKYWDETVKPAITEHLKSVHYKDGTSSNYLSALAWRVEHDLADDRLIFAIPQLLQAVETLNSKSYWENVWNNDLGSDEAKRLKKIGELLKKLWDIYEFERDGNGN
jgi:hypothetical protein